MLLAVPEPGGLPSNVAVVLILAGKMSIRINATVHEARTAAGHSREQWDRFYVSLDSRGSNVVRG